MRATELLRLVWLNINQNKFKTIMTSIGIVVGAATIVMVIAIGRGGKMDVAEQFASLNAGAIDITYEWEEEETSSGGGFSFGNMIGNLFSAFGGGGSAPGGGSGQNTGSSAGGSSGSSSGGSQGMPGGSSGPSSGGSQGMPGGSSDSSSGSSGSSSDQNSGGQRPDMSSGSMGTPGESGDQGGGMQGESRDQESRSEMPDADDDPNAEQAEEAEEETDEEGSIVDDRINQEQVILSAEDAADIETFVSGITGATISYTTRGAIEGGSLDSEQNYTIAGVKSNYMELSNLSLDDGDFLSEDEDESKSRVCVLGATAAKEIFGSSDAVGEQIYIEDRSYTVIGVLSASGTVSGGISPDTSVFIPYQTGIKYITGTDISPTLTVIAEDVDSLSQVIADVKTVLRENYPDTEFTFSDAGSKMEAAQSSNETLTLLLSAVAVIVFIVGGIGSMNVLFVSVKERTNEIGILKALGGSKSMILTEFLIESAAISMIGGILGVGISFLITPIVEHYGIRVEINLFALLVAVGFAVLTGTIFGLYPAWKASRLEPVDALNEE